MIVNGNITTLIMMVITFALVDSVDPCIFALLVSLLTSSTLINVRYAVKIGCSFILSVYLGYVLFGLLIRYTALVLPKTILVTVIITYALVILATTLHDKKNSQIVCREDDIPCRLVSKLRLSKVTVNATTAGIMGFIAAFTLLPCSAGLYVLYNITTTHFGYTLWIPLTLLYVLVFISPLVLIMLGVVGLSRTGKVHTLLINYEKPLKIAASIIMLIVALYLLLV